MQGAPSLKVEKDTFSGSKEKAQGRHPGEEGGKSKPKRLLHTDDSRLVKKPSIGTRKNVRGGGYLVASYWLESKHL